MNDKRLVSVNPTRITKPIKDLIGSLPWIEMKFDKLSLESYNQARKELNDYLDRYEEYMKSSVEQPDKENTGLNKTINELARGLHVFRSPEITLKDRLQYFDEVKSNPDSKVINDREILVHGVIRIKFY